MMENQSLRPTPLAFTQSTISGCNLYADLQHVHRILYLILFDFSRRMFLNIFNGSFYAEKQQLSEVSVQIQFRDVLSISPTTIFSGIFIGLFRWNAACTGRSMRHSSRIFYESPHAHSFQFHVTHDNSSSIAKISDLISEGITSPWVEYNDGCAWGCGIHSLLFVIYYF